MELQVSLIDCFIIKIKEMSKRLRERNSDEDYRKSIKKVKTDLMEQNGEKGKIYLI